MGRFLLAAAAGDDDGDDDDECDDDECDGDDGDDDGDDDFDGDDDDCDDDDDRNDDDDAVLPSTPLCSVLSIHTINSIHSARWPMMKRLLDSTTTSWTSSCGDTVLLKLLDDHSLRRVCCLFCYHRQEEEVKMVI